MSNHRPLTGLAASIDPERLDRGITQSHLTREQVRAFTIEPGDVLHAQGNEVVSTVRHDPPGRSGRKVHLTTTTGTTATFNLNEVVEISR